MATQPGFEEGFDARQEESLDVLVREIFAKVPGAVEGYIYDQVKVVIKDFFERSKVWRRGLGPYVWPEGATYFQVNPVDARTKAIQVLEVTRNGRPLSRSYPDAAGKANLGVSRWFVEPYDVVHLFPAPDKDLEDIYISVVLTPRLLKCDRYIQQWILDKHYEALLAGTFQRLHQEVGKPYSNAEQATYWGRRYRSELARAKAEGNANYGGTQPWRFPVHTR